MSMADNHQEVAMCAVRLAEAARVNRQPDRAIAHLRTHIAHRAAARDFRLLYAEQAKAVKP